jgi:hypothetical protein
VGFTGRLPGPIGTDKLDVPAVGGLDARGNRVVVGGQTTGTLGQMAFGKEDGFLRAYDKKGDVVWTLQFGSPEADVREADPFGHLLSVHNPTGPDLYRDEPWASYGILQGPKTSDRARLGREIRESRHPTKPLCAQETPPGNRYQLLEHEGRDFQRRTSGRTPGSS